MPCQLFCGLSPSSPHQAITLAGSALASRPAEQVRARDPDTDHELTLHRAVDTLALMRRNGKIPPEMEAAARDFAAAFTVAQLDTLKMLPLARIPGQPPAAPCFADGSPGRRAREGPSAPSRVLGKQ